MNEEDDRSQIRQMRDVLFGVPGDADRPGLFQIAVSNQRQIRDNADAIEKLRLLLKGNNGQGDGVLDRVRNNTAFRRRVERFGLWLGGILGAAALIQLAQGIVWVWQQMGGP